MVYRNTHKIIRLKKSWAIILTQAFKELGLKPGDEVLVEVDDFAETIYIRKR